MPDSRQLVQAAVVGLALFTFFLALGVLVVTPETAEQWIGERVLAVHAVYLAVREPAPTAPQGLGIG